MMWILADQAAPECCWAAAGLRAGMGMATRQPEVWRWREEPCDRALEINATTCHTGCRQSRGDGRASAQWSRNQRHAGRLGGGDGKRHSPAATGE